MIKEYNTAKQPKKKIQIISFKIICHNNSDMYG